MRARLMTTAGVLAVALGVVAVWSTGVAGQAQSGRPAAATRAAAPAKPLVNPRTADGHPDLQGVYDVATLTPLERPEMFGNNLSLTNEQAKRLEGQVADRK